MTPKKIYLIRHGETDFNRQQVIQGSGVDTSLNALGKLQAAAFYDAYRHIPFDKVYTSTLKRSIESVRGFLEKGIAHEALPELNEINWGEKEGRRITVDDDADYRTLLANWSSGNYDARVNNGESAQEMAIRQQPFLEKLKTDPAGHILVCMHGRAMRAFLCQLLHLELRCMEGFEHQNLCLYKIVFTGSLFYVKRYCDRRHLQNLTDPIA